MFLFFFSSNCELNEMKRAHLMGLVNGFLSCVCKSVSLEDVNEKKFFSLCACVCVCVSLGASECHSVTGVGKSVELAL